MRVYTQTWYYWATANWLQILFCLTLVLLILSTCVTVSVMTVTRVTSVTCHPDLDVRNQSEVQEVPWLQW